MEVTVSRAVRTRTQSLTPDDFADIAPCESVDAVGLDALVVTFAVDLTPAQVQRVRLRCIAADADEEATLLAAAQAHTANEAYLALTNRTTAQNLAQVEALTRQVQGLIRYVARL